jgi:hypothetical protein
MNNNLVRLSERFEPVDIEFRAGATNKDKSQCLALAYITSRAVMDRLDNVVGSANWSDHFVPGPNGGVLCGISIKINDEWITKWDGADNTDIEGIKGGLADSFKRAAVKWGVGRYLYSLPAVWVRAIPRGRNVVPDENEARRKILASQPANLGIPVVESDSIGSPRTETVNLETGERTKTFAKFDDFLHALHTDFQLGTNDAKDILKSLGFTGFTTAKSDKMYAAVREYLAQPETA